MQKIRMSLALKGLLRTGASDPVATSRVLGVFYIAGSALVAASVVLPHPEGASVAGLLAIVCVAAVVGSGSIFGAKHARMWTVQTVLAAGTVLICLCLYFAGVESGIYSSMFVWVVLVAASFFAQRAVAAHLIWILLTWGLTLSLVTAPTGSSGLTTWILGGFVLAVSALVMSEIVAGLRSAEARLHNEARERERLQRELKHLAHHDPLTDLPNRRLFEREFTRELGRATRKATPLCVVAIDLNQFKQYNDRNGHSAGDELLKLAAAAWVSALRAEDSIARLGGDEFVALLPDCPLAEAEGLAQRLCRGVPLDQTCSTGIACWDRRESAQELLTRADKAMYESKERTTARAVVHAARRRQEAPKVA